MRNTVAAWSRCLLLGGAMYAVAGAAQAARSVVGSDGEVFRVVRSALGELDPSVAADERGNQVLAIEIRKAGQPSRRVLVPQTENFSSEDFENLVYERESKTLFIVWQGMINIHPVVFLGRYSAGAWAEPAYLTRNTFTPKYSPQIVVTRDASGVTPRVIAHLAWAEETSAGEVETYYSPIILSGEDLSGGELFFRLNDFDTSDAANLSFEASEQLLRSPRLRTGRDGQSVVVSFADRSTRRLVTLEIDAQPASLSRVASEARHHVIILGSKSFGAQGTKDRQNFADSLRKFTLDTATNFVPEVRALLANDLRDLVLAEPQSGSDGLQRVAFEARHHVIILGSRVRGRGLAEASDAIAQQFVEVGGLDEVVTQDFRFAVNSSAPIVRVGDSEAVTLHPSETGRRLALSWSNGERLRYREWTAAGWSEPYDITLTPDFTAAEAAKAVDEKVNGR
jgi:hypothetical protein